MTKHAEDRYELFYWPGIQGRGEFIRLAFEEAGVPYVDVARQSAQEGGGVAALQKALRGDGKSLKPFAAPFVRVGDVVVAQVANVLQFLGPRLGLVPEDEDARRDAHQLQLTLADLVSEVHETHHPISNALYYEDQKDEARRRASAFVGERLPKFLGYFEEVLERNTRSEGRHLVGEALTYVDLSAFQVLSGLGYAFPNGLAQVAANIPRLLALRDHVAARPRIAAYLASERRLPFNEQGIFRRYPELDAAPVH
ncbi:glutathione S-transferase [Chondromyces apiculatus]|uniref:Glutathione S-transferase n=1 Tax=Chondromyces apiculatus DSM 436 TaxID=1192034 RepID=A0A017TCG4_9BACT|nr:glutathione S-transferase [Chondromyces apiculatus]EYF06321.1 Glutathione S-transferase [Chondromyces apiculatus DSM 436]